MALLATRLILLLITCVFAWSQAFAAESSAPLSLSIDKMNLHSQSKEWTATRPAIDRIFLTHSSKKKFILANEFGSRLSVKEVESYFLSSFARDAKIQRQREINVDDSVLQNFSADSFAKDGKRIGRVTYSMTFPESAAGFTEYIWAEQGKVWQVVIVSLSSKLVPSPESYQSDIDAIFEQISGRNKTASWLQFIFPRSEARETLASGAMRGTETVQTPPTHLGWVPGFRTPTREQCLSMNIPPEKLGMPPGAKIVNAQFIRACGPGLKDGFDKTVDGARAMFIAGLKTVTSHAEAILAKHPCVEPDRPENVWDVARLTTYSVELQSYSTCLSSAGGRAIVVSSGDLAKAAVDGAASLINWIRTTEDKVATVIRMVQEKVDGFDCLNAHHQGQVACEFLGKVGTGAAAIIGTAAITGGASAFATAGSGLSAGARAIIAINGAGRSAKAVLMAPVAATQAVYSGGRSVVRGTRDLITRKPNTPAAADTKSVMTGPAVGVLARNATEPTDASAAAVAAAEKPAWKIKETPDEFRDRLLKFDPTTDVERLDMMQLVYTKMARSGQVLDVENAFLKDLNDKEWLREGNGPFKKDRDLVTALTNQHKQILQAKMKEFAAKYGKELDIKSYSDFKSQRFALIPKKGEWQKMGIPKAVLDDLEKTYREANEEFAKKVADLGIESKLDPKKWFNAGMDSSADEANLNARLARKLPKNDGGIVRSNTLLIKKMKVDAYQAITAARSKLDRLPKDSPLLANVEETRIPKPEIFDIVKKNSGSPEKLEASLRSFYPGVELPEGIAADLIDYAKKTDTFQPGIWQSSRQVASVAEAHHGGITIDVTGMGSNNAYQTALQAAKCVSLLQLTKCTRDGERSVTREFHDKMNAIRDVSLANCKKHGLDCFVRISGDDVVVIPTNGTLPRTFARDNITGINNAIGTGRVRQAEIPPGVANGPHRVELGQHGESIEKLVRNNLGSGSLAPRLKDLTFSVRMGTQVPNIGSVRVLFSGPAAKNLSYAERKALLEAYRKAVDEFNELTPGRDYTLTP